MYQLTKTYHIPSKRFKTITYQDNHKTWVSANLEISVTEQYSSVESCNKSLIFRTKSDKMHPDYGYLYSIVQHRNNETGKTALVCCWLKEL